MSPEYELVMYTRTRDCPFVSLARQVLARAGVPYRAINIDSDAGARAWLLEHVHYLSVPTLVIALPGEDRPHTAPEPLPAGASPRGIDRGPVLTEPGAAQLEDWLRRHGLAGGEA
ncbi:MAG: glutaredoxin family protein [Anaerolineae bacterium]|nr:glutaredoxin family protein [Anaerolineae bacterium]